MDNRKDPNTLNQIEDVVSTDVLVGNIVQDLTPVRPYYADRIVLLAIVISIVAGCLVLFYGGSVRISYFELGVAGILWNLRVLLAQVVFLMSSIMIVDLAVPRSSSLFERRSSRFFYLSLIGLFLFAFLVCTFFADIPDGVNLKRTYCIEEGVVIGLVAVLLISFSLRRSLSPHRHLLVGALLMWTTFITINFMDVTCMVSMSHSLRCHLLPILLAGVPSVVFLGSRLKRF